MSNKANEANEVANEVALQTSLALNLQQAQQSLQCASLMIDWLLAKIKLNTLQNEYHSITMNLKNLNQKINQKIIQLGKCPLGLGKCPLLAKMNLSKNQRIGEKIK